jgi:hypothetical protein
MVHADEILGIGDAQLTIRINGASPEFAVGGGEAVRPAPAANEGVEPTGSDQVVLSPAGSAAAAAVQASVSSGQYEPDSLLTAGKIIDNALQRIG